eukprot:scaffold43600_cov36-Cyclotella_meneghiniana.AAC.4
MVHMKVVVVHVGGVALARAGLGAVCETGRAPINLSTLNHPNLHQQTKRVHARNITSDELYIAPSGVTSTASADLV